MVDKAFLIMDKDKSGEITGTDLKGIFTAKEHPDVRSGRKTEEQVFVQFLSTFEGTEGNHDGIITKQEWVG